MWRFYLEGPSAVPPGMPYNETYSADGKEQKTCEPAITLVSGRLGRDNSFRR